MREILAGFAFENEIDNAMKINITCYISGPMENVGFFLAVPTTTESVYTLCVGTSTS